MKKLVTLFLLLFSFTKLIQSQTDVTFALLGSRAGEPFIDSCFIKGYESTGKTWMDTIRFETNVSTYYLFSTILPLALIEGQTLVCRPSSVSDRNADAQYYYSRGLQLVGCPGSNVYHSRSYFLPLGNIMTGAGGEAENTTSYNTEFHDVHPYSNFPITNLQQMGDTLLVSIDISVNGGFTIPNGFGVTFQNVTGWTNNLSGLKQVIKPVNSSSFKILHNLNSGSFQSGGIAQLYFQSYSSAFVAGKMAAVKDSLSCSWWEARYRLRQTASNGGEFTTFDGYGKPNTHLALAYTGTIVSDPYYIGNVFITGIIEGFYSPGANSMNPNDTVTAYFRNSISPYVLVDSSKCLINSFISESLVVIGAFKMLNTPTGNYYIVLKHRSGLETWSNTSVPYLLGDNLSYDFTSDSTSAFGSNMKRVDWSPIKYGIYSGDVNQNGSIDGSDVGLVEYDAANFIEGYTTTDLTGNNFVDGVDQLIAENNAFNFVNVTRP